MPIEPADLVCVTEIAAMCDVCVSAVSNWQKRNVVFPEPWGTWALGSLWLRSDIEDWYGDRLAAKEQARLRSVAFHERELVRLRQLES